MDKECSKNGGAKVSLRGLRQRHKGAVIGTQDGGWVQVQRTELRMWYRGQNWVGAEVQRMCGNRGKQDGWGELGYA